MKQTSKSLFKNASWNSFYIFFNIAFTFIITPILISYFGIEIYGLYILLISLSGAFGIVTFGLGEATLRYVAFYNNRHENDQVSYTVSSTLAVYAIVTSIFIILINIYAEPVVKILNLNKVQNIDSALMIKLTVYFFAITIFRRAFDAIIRGLERYDVSTITSVVETILKAIGIILIISLKKGLVEFLMLHIFVTILITFVLIKICKNLLPNLRLFTKPGIKNFKEIFAFGFFSMLIFVFYQIQTQLDKILLGSLLGTAFVAFISVPRELVMRANSFLQSIADVLLPRFSAISDDGSLKYTLSKSLWIFMFLGFIIFLPIIFLIGDFLKLWLGIDFAEKSRVVGQIIAISYLLNVITLPLDSFFKGMAKPKYTTLIVFIAGTTFLSLCIFLIPRYGLLGAAYSYIPTQLLSSVVSLFLAFKISKIIRLTEFLKLSNNLMLSAGLIIIVFYKLSKFLIIDNWLSFIFVAFIYFLTSLACLSICDIIFKRHNSNVLLLTNRIRKKYNNFGGKRFKIL